VIANRFIWSSNSNWAGIFVKLKPLSKFTCRSATGIDHVRDKAWSSCYLEFPFHSRNFCFMFEGKSTKEMHLKFIEQYGDLEVTSI